MYSCKKLFILLSFLYLVLIARSKKKIEKKRSVETAPQLVPGVFWMLSVGSWLTCQPVGRCFLMSWEVDASNHRIQTFSIGRPVCFWSRKKNDHDPNLKKKDLLLAHDRSMFRRKRIMRIITKTCMEHSKTSEVVTLNSARAC